MNEWIVDSNASEYERRAAIYWNAYIDRKSIGYASAYVDYLYNNYLFWFIAATCGKSYAQSNFSI